MPWRNSTPLCNVANGWGSLGVQKELMELDLTTDEGARMEWSQLIVDLDQLLRAIHDAENSVPHRSTPQPPRSRRRASSAPSSPRRVSATQLLPRLGLAKPVHKTFAIDFEDVRKFCWHGCRLPLRNSQDCGAGGNHGGRQHTCCSC